MSDENDMLTMTALGRFEPGDIDPEAFHVLLTGSPRAVGRAGQFLGEAVELTTAAALARAERAEVEKDALFILLEAERTKVAASQRSVECEEAARERAEALLAEAVEALRSVRDPVPDVMRSLMAIGRDGLLLADRVHRADDKARATLAKLEAKP